MLCTALVRLFERRRPSMGTAVTIAVCAGMAIPAAETAVQNNGSGWTLQDLVEVALERNPNLAASRMASAAAQEDIRAAKGERLPRLYAVGLGEYFPRRERLLIFRHGFRRDENAFQDAIVSYGLEVTLPLYTGGRIRHGISLARARAEAAGFRSALTRNELIFNLASGYYTALRLQQVIAAQEASLESLRESQRVANLQRDVGRIASLDTLRLETQVSQGERDLVVARNAHAIAREVLKELISVPTEVILEITGKLVAAATNFPLEQMREQALSNRPDIIALRRELRAQRAAVGIAGARLRPTVDFNAKYLGLTGVDDGITKDDAQLFLRFRMPLYTGGVLSAGKRKAIAKLKEAEFRLRDAERRALTELEQAALRLRDAEPRITAARRAVDQADESLRVEREKFAEGRGTSNDLLLSDEALLRARTELATALSDSQIALAALRFSVGEEPVPVTPISTNSPTKDD